MLRGDLLCRAAIFPKFVNDDVFDEEQLFQPHKVNEKFYAFSVTSRFCARTENEVHAAGKNTANIQNVAYLDRKGVEPDPRSEYLGYYELLAGVLHDVNMRCYSVSIRWNPEHGNTAHFQVEFHQTSPGTSDRDRRTDRRTAINDIAKRASGPVLMQAASYSQECAALLPLLKDLGSGRRESDQ